MKRAAICALLAGCAAVDDLDAVWEPAATFPGAEIGPPPAPRPPPAGPLRIASWNTYFAEDPEAHAREILASPDLSTADIILVQEIDAYVGESTRARRLAEALGMTWFYAPELDAGDHTHGQAIFSRYPLADPRVMILPRADMRIRPTDRVALVADVELDGARRVRVVDVHLDTRIGPVDRIRQLHPAVIDHPAATVVAGDLNTLPWAFIESAVPLTGTEAIVGHSQAKILDDYMAALGYASAIAPDEVTHTAPLVNLHLDGLYIRGAGLGASGVARDVSGSDHWPIWADVIAD